MDAQGHIAAVIEQHVGFPVVGPENRLIDAPPIFFFRHAFPGENRNALGRNGGGGVILRRENIAADQRTEAPR